ncbi:MAG: 16S rRNA (cytidine(1402)-2'-O)-methyltransferase [Nitrospinae bacterium]|nr:16S rRNA (cytidine(1402)-2'-O)-methyltransferase [Nitrospinota bacterium]
MQPHETGKLFIVATPIGNLEDITLRALNVLKEVDVIAAEDTRHTRKLLQHFGISKRVTSYYQNRETAKAGELLKLLRSGMSVALVSDAGTPGISDPGFVVIREALAENIETIPIPGVSSAIAALSASGLKTDRFVFEGFLPRKEGKRAKRLQLLAEEERTVIFFESPHRVLETLRELAAFFNGRKIVIAREITKKFEEFIRGTLPEALEGLEERKNFKGEFTIILEGKP